MAIGKHWISGQHCHNIKKACVICFPYSFEVRLWLLTQISAILMFVFSVYTQSPNLRFAGLLQLYCESSQSHLRWRLYFLSLVTVHFAMQSIAFASQSLKGEGLKKLSPAKLCNLEMSTK